MFQSARWRLFFGLCVVTALFVAVLWGITRLRNQSSPSKPEATSATPASGPANSPNVFPALSPSSEREPSPQESSAVASPSDGSLNQTPDQLKDESNFVGHLKLIIPVAGVRADQLHDTFTESRSEGRVHDAIDIPAPAGTPVLAATDGQIIKLFQSEKGGTTVYQLSVDRKLVYYYAHLQSYAPSISEGKSVRQGEVIAFVGDTGNATPGNFHLHFSIAVVADPKRYWEGTNINPFPLLRGH